MGKKKVLSSEAAEDAPGRSLLNAPTVDPALAALFASSSGPVNFTRLRVTRQTSGSIPRKRAHVDEPIPVADSAPEDGTDQTPDSGSEGISGSEKSRRSYGSEDEVPRKKRKRRQLDQKADLETSYMNRLAREEEREERLRKLSEPRGGIHPLNKNDGEDDGIVTDEENSSLVGAGENNPILQHESITMSEKSAATEKASRTVFIGNVSTSAIKSKAAKKSLLSHMSSHLANLKNHTPPHKVESLRFRSTAFASGVGPRKAAFAKKELMDETTKSTNAYVVYSTTLAARTAASKLNGTVVLDRHLRVDYVGNPAKHDHRRCVFVGNLGFVDEEPADPPVAGEEDKLRRPKAKHPADAEEGLWQTFGKVGKVESVRVVRDRETRVGKGFAYVQFADENAVEAALGYNEKKFPPMLPRKLRVMRAKRIKERSGTQVLRADGFKAQQANSRSRSVPSKPGTKDRNLMNKARGKETRNSRDRGMKKRESFVFEGHRATKPSEGKSGSAKTSGKRGGGKPRNRSSRRGAAFKASGGKKKRS